MPNWGIFEYYRQRAQELEQRRKPQPTPTVWAPGCMELNGMAGRAGEAEAGRAGEAEEVLNRAIRSGVPIPAKFSSYEILGTRQLLRPGDLLASPFNSPDLCVPPPAGPLTTSATPPVEA
jgi:hypothetical protein